MQRRISRRDFGKRLAGGAALLALQTGVELPRPEGNRYAMT